MFNLPLTYSWYDGSGQGWWKTWVILLNSYCLVKGIDQFGCWADGWAMDDNTPNIRSMGAGEVRLVYCPWMDQPPLRGQCTASFIDCRTFYFESAHWKKKSTNQNWTFSGNVRWITWQFYPAIWQQHRLFLFFLFFFVFFLLIIIIIIKPISIAPWCPSIQRLLFLQAIQCQIGVT